MKAVVALGAVLAVSAAVLPVAASTTTIVLTPSVDHPSATISVKGTGFSALEQVRVEFDTSQVATASTSSAGSFSTNFKVPASATPGNHLVTAVGQTSGRSAIRSFLVQTDWAKFHYGPANSGFNPYENVVGPSNVSGLVTAWTGTTGGGIQSPAVANGVVYVGSTDRKLYAFSAAACAANPATCAPLWTGGTGGLIESSPAVVNGLVYVGSDDGNVYAFNAAGTTNCAGSPKTCTPIWTGATGGAVVSAPVVYKGVVYVGSLDDKFYAFSAAGTTNCSGTPTTCMPLWIGASGKREIFTSAAVANGVVYIGSENNKLYAFSAAASSTNCSGIPRICKPLWTGATGGILESSPAVSNGVVYVGSTSDQVYAFSAAGSTNCSGSPRTCAPIWTGATGGVDNSSPAVANGVMYIGSSDGKLYAFSAAGTTNCSGIPTVCSPLWTGATGMETESSPGVADGVVYIGSDDGNLYAFSATGKTNCSGTPTTCTPLWIGATGSPIRLSSPAVSDGVIYVGSSDGRLHAFSR